MKKLESSLTNMLLVLTGVTAISVALLAYMNKLTDEPIKQAAAKTLNEALAKVLPTFDGEIKPDTLFGEKNGKQTVDFILYRAENQGEWVGTAVESVSLGFGGDLKVLIGFDAEGKIYGYSVLASAETPGLGSKAGDWFQKEAKGDIIGRSIPEKGLKVDKDGGEVQAITASTITSRAFLSAVNAAYSAYAQANQSSQSVVGENIVKLQNDTISADTTSVEGIAK